MNYQFYDYIKNKYYEELKDISPTRREALIFSKTCEEIPLEIKDTDFIAGRYGTESSVDFETYENKEFEYYDMFMPEERLVRDAFFEDFCFGLSFDRGHTCIDYKTVINSGLTFYETKVKDEISKGGHTSQKTELLEAMLSAFDSVRTYVSRFAQIAHNLYESSGDEKYARMRDTLVRVPFEPCSDFYEALSAVWIMHSLIPISDNSWASISLGRFDQYLYPFYIKSLQNGESEETLKKYLVNFFEYLNLYGDGACAMNIGAMDKDGNDLTNELSYILTEVEKELALPSPIFAVRVSPSTPDDLLDEVTDLKLFGIGQPTFYGELPCRKAIEMRGVPFDEAVNYSVNSCMGLCMAGEEIASMWGCVFNMHLPLELAVNSGKPLFCEMPFEPDTEMEQLPDSLDSLIDAYGAYLAEIMGVIQILNRKNAHNCAVNTPNPFLSALTANCIESGLDRAIGAKYNTETVETYALANTANAICAIDTLVFKEKKYTLAQYVEATKNNFEGYEDIKNDILKCPKYGQANEYADGVVKRICEITSDICRDISYENVYFLPSFHTLAGNVDFGKILYTTLDAREAGTPVAKNAGPTNDVRCSDPTSIVVSAASIGQERFSGGQPIDLYFDKAMFDSKQQRDKIKTLIKTYFELGGLQLQVNSVDVETLEKAFDNPEEYSHVVVRVGGYSMQFVKLSEDQQREFITRFKKEKN